MGKNNDMLDLLNSWTKRIRMNKSATNIEAEEQKMQDPPATPGAFAEQNEQKMKEQSGVAGAENVSDGTAEMREDGTVADAEPLAETSDTAEVTTHAEDTAEEEAKLASVDSLILSIEQLVNSATKKASNSKPASAKAAATPAKAATKPAEPKTAALEKEATDEQVIEFLGGLWKQAGYKEEMTEANLIKVAINHADADAERFATWVGSIIKSAEELTPTINDPAEEEALLQELLAGGGEEGGDEELASVLAEVLAEGESGGGGGGEGELEDLLSGCTDEDLAALLGEGGGEEEISVDPKTANIKLAALRYLLKNSNEQELAALLGGAGEGAEAGGGEEEVLAALLGGAGGGGEEEELAALLEGLAGESDPAMSGLPPEALTQILDELQATDTGAVAPEEGEETEAVEDVEEEVEDDSETTEEEEGV